MKEILYNTTVQLYNGILGTLSFLTIATIAFLMGYLTVTGYMFCFSILSNHYIVIALILSILGFIFGLVHNN